ncbi:MAG: hypothetical protein E6J81_15765 [Deltaproteobacteria bacterium]|nr:MAG: hypothetical protein E6J81_15765 [Deltaproteobacteria bacterium]
MLGLHQLDEPVVLWWPLCGCAADESFVAGDQPLQRFGRRHSGTLRHDSQIVTVMRRPVSDMTSRF